jgi:hypothetical protein
LLNRLRERLTIGEVDVKQRQKELAELTKRLEKRVDERNRVAGFSAGTGLMKQPWTGNST